MSVAVPPMLEAMISVMKNGTGLNSSILQTVKVTGPISNTVVTLSKNAERTAVIMQNNTMITHGLPFAIFAVRIAMYSNMPRILNYGNEYHHAYQDAQRAEVDVLHAGIKTEDTCQDEHNGARKRGDRTVDLF